MIQLKIKNVVCEKRVHVLKFTIHVYYIENRKHIEK